MSKKITVALVDGTRHEFDPPAQGVSDVEAEVIDGFLWLTIGDETAGVFNAAHVVSLISVTRDV